MNLFLLIVVLVTLCNSTVATESASNITKFSLIKPFYGNNSDLSAWEFVGPVIMTINYLRLTEDERSQQGAAWTKNPLYYKNWEIIFHFKIVAEGASLYGDGLALWYTKDRMIPGKVFGSKDYFSGMAIIIDTYLNSLDSHDRPYISLMVNNGSLSYNQDLDGSDTEVAGCMPLKRQRDV